MSRSVRSERSQGDIIARWSDAQRIARYELQQDFYVDPNAPVNASPYDMREHVEQISGP